MISPIPYLILNDLERFTSIDNAENILLELASYEVQEDTPSEVSNSLNTTELFNILYEQAENEVIEILNKSQYNVPAVLGIVSRSLSYVPPKDLSLCGTLVRITEFVKDYHLKVNGGIHAFRCYHPRPIGNITIRIEDSSVPLSMIIVNGVELPNVLQDGNPVPSSANPLTYEFQVSNNQLIEIHYSQAVEVGALLNLRIYASTQQNDGSYLYDPEYGELIPTYRQSPLRSNELKKFFTYSFFFSAIRRNNFSKDIIREGRRQSDIIGTLSGVETFFEEERRRILNSIDVLDTLQDFHVGSILTNPKSLPDEPLSFNVL